MTFPRRRFFSDGKKQHAMGTAKAVIVTAALELIDAPLAKQHGIVGTYFRSTAEAKRWIALVRLEKAGYIRNLRRQVAYPLHVVGPDGLKVKVGKYTTDHVYEERHAVHPGETGDAWQWVEVIEDVKPSGGWVDEVYVWRKRHFESEYGKTISEFTGR